LIDTKQSSFIEKPALSSIQEPSS